MGSRGTPSDRGYADFRDLGIKEVKDADDFFSRHSNFDKWLDGKTMSDDEYDAIKSYTGSEYRGINKALRTPEKFKDNPTSLKYYNEKADKAEKGLDKTKLNRNLTVYRGASIKLFGMDKVNYDELKKFEGGKIRDLGFMSATPFKRASWIETDSQGNPKQDNSVVMLKINVPKGKGRGAWVNPFSAHGGTWGEKEFLINRASVLQIKKITQSPAGGIEVEVDWVKKDKSNKWDM